MSKNFVTIRKQGDSYELFLHNKPDAYWTINEEDKIKLQDAIINAIASGEKHIIDDEIPF